jgi:hypothetical protein
VIISHGTPPYIFTFWRFADSQKRDIKQTIPIENSREYVEFAPPVVVDKGRYIHVVLNFRLVDGKEVSWIDDLYYPSSEFDPACR